MATTTSLSEASVLLGLQAPGHLEPPQVGRHQPRPSSSPRTTASTIPMVPRWARVTLKWTSFRTLRGGRKSETPEKDVEQGLEDGPSKHNQSCGKIRFINNKCWVVAVEERWSNDEDETNKGEGDIEDINHLQLFRGVLERRMRA